jgi:hypothetical protein
VKVAKEGVLDDIAKGATGLKHVDVVADKSAPVIPSDVTIKPSPMAALKKELTGSSPELKHIRAQRIYCLCRAITSKVFLRVWRLLPDHKTVR